MEILKYKDENGVMLPLYEIYKPEPDPFNGYEYVDMGDAGIWATCNVGASSSEEPGLFFAWGEVEGYPNTNNRLFDWANYKFGNYTSSYADLTKYNKTDGLTTLELEDDAANIYMSGGWRIPTQNEFQKLYDLCDKEWTDNYEGVKGGIFKLKTDESKQLFLPAPGYGIDSRIFTQTNDGIYWTSSLHSSKLSTSMVLQFTDKRFNTPFGFDRCNGCSIRAIYDPSLKSE